MLANWLINLHQQRLCHCVSLLVAGSARRKQSSSSSQAERPNWQSQLRETVCRPASRLRPQSAYVEPQTSSARARHKLGTSWLIRAGFSDCSSKFPPQSRENARSLALARRGSSLPDGRLSSAHCERGTKKDPKRQGNDDDQSRFIQHFARPPNGGPTKWKSGSEMRARDVLWWENLEEFWSRQAQMGKLILIQISQI